MSKSEHINDWYTIVRAEHDGRKWWKEISTNSFQLMMSERLSPEACIEGTSSEIIAVAKAIKNRLSVWFKRIAVNFEDDGVHFYSPKNSERDAVVSVEEAEELANQILAELNVRAVEE